MYHLLDTARLSVMRVLCAPVHVFWDDIVLWDVLWNMIVLGCVVGCICGMCFGMCYGMTLCFRRELEAQWPVPNTFLVFRTATWGLGTWIGQFSLNRLN